MNLTQDEQWFLEDIKTKLSRGITLFKYQWEIPKEHGIEILREHLGQDIFLMPKYKDFYSHDWYIVAEFGQWFTVGYDGEVGLYYPKPFEKIPATSVTLVKNAGKAIGLSNLMKYQYKQQQGKPLPLYKRLFKNLFKRFI